MASQRKIGALLGYINIIVKNLVNLLYTPMLLSFVGQADYGVYQTANSFVFSLTLLTFGFSEAYVRFYTLRKVEGTEGDIRVLNGMYLLLYAVICSVVLVLGLVFSANVDRFFSGSFTPDQVGLAGDLMAVMACNVALTLFSTVFDAYIVAHEQFKFQQTRQMLTSLVTPCAAFALLNMGMGAVGVALAQLFVTLLLLILNVRFACLRLGMRFALSGFDASLFRSIAAFSAWIFANQVCELVNQSVPNMVLGAVAGALAVSVFAVSIQVRQVFYSLSTTMASVFTPLINRIVAESDDNEVLTKLMTRVGRYQAILYLWVLGGFALLGRFFIIKWAGQDFEEAYWLILAMVTPLFIPLVQNTGVEIQRAKNKHRARSLCYLCAAGLNLSVTFALAPVMGYWAPVIGYTAYVLLGTGVFMNWYYAHGIGLNMAYFWGRVFPVVGIALIAVAVCAMGEVLFPVLGWGMFVMWGIVYSLLYAFLIWSMILSANERATIKSKLRRD